MMTRFGKFDINHRLAGMVFGAIAIAGAAVPAFAAWEPTTVSYTHLTLPTIYSV